jgi:hypothetical protein
VGSSKRPAARAGRTEKVSISLERTDLTMLRRRARRFHGGNLSAVIAEGVRRVSEEEGREALVGWLGDAAGMTAAEQEAVRAEWRADMARRRTRAR